MNNNYYFEGLDIDITTSLYGYDDILTPVGPYEAAPESPVDSFGEMMDDEDNAVDFNYGFYNKTAAETPMMELQEIVLPDLEKKERNLTTNYYYDDDDDDSYCPSDWSQGNEEDDVVMKDVDTEELSLTAVQPQSQFCVAESKVKDSMSFSKFCGLVRAKKVKKGRAPKSFLLDFYNNLVSKKAVGYVRSMRISCNMRYFGYKDKNAKPVILAPIGIWGNIRVKDNKKLGEKTPEKKYCFGFPSCEFLADEISELSNPGGFVGFKCFSIQRRTCNGIYDEEKPLLLPESCWRSCRKCVMDKKKKEVLITGECVLKLLPCFAEILDRSQKKKYKATYYYRFFMQLGFESTKRLLMFHVDMKANCQSSSDKKLPYEIYEVSKVPFSYQIYEGINGVF